MSNSLNKIKEEQKNKLLDRLKEALLDDKIKDFFYRNFMISSLLEKSNACIFEKDLYPIILKAFNIAKKNKYVEKNPFSFNDDEDKVFIIPNKNKKILVYENQNSSYLFLDEKDYFSIRLIYQSLEEIPESYYDHEKIKDVLKECNANYFNLAKYASTFMKYSDYVCGNKYVSRPSLTYYKDQKYEIRYHDKRDPGHVLTYHKYFSKIEISSDFSEDFFKCFFLGLIENEYGEFKC